MVNPIISNDENVIYKDESHKGGVQMDKLPVVNLKGGLVDEWKNKIECWKKKRDDRPD